ncbi:hypothetical protein ACQKWADRAFT_326069 [Trichoderma austrokoningii]
MAPTQAQEAAKKRRNLEEDPGQEAPAPKRQYQKSSHEDGERAVGDTCDLTPNPSSEQRPTPRPSTPERLGNATIANADASNPIDFWIKEGRWPSYLFEPELELLLAQKLSLSAFGGRRRSISASSITTPSDQKPREERNTMYRDPRYTILFKIKGTFLFNLELDITDESKSLCKDLLERKQVFPENSLFHDDFFHSACQNLQDQNEARIIQDISRLIVPSAESLATCGAEHLEILVESVNAGWNNSIPLTSIRPQPDYSIGFRREAFTEEQLKKLSPFIGDFIAGDLSYFMATYYMYFPFFACEVESGAGSLDFADRQNAHSMTLAARGVVELFRLVGRETEVHRQILAFSEIKYYRYPIRNVSFIELDGQKRWVAYQFTKNIYDVWMPDHFKRITSAIDQIPANVDFGVQALSESTGFSQGLQTLATSDSASLPPDQGDQSLEAGLADTSATSFVKPGPVKKRKSPAE